MGEPLRHDEVMPRGVMPTGSRHDGTWVSGGAAGARPASRGGQLRLLPDGAQEGTDGDVIVPGGQQGAAAGAPEAGPQVATLGAVISLAEHLAGMSSGAVCFACGSGRIEHAVDRGGAASLTCRRCGAAIEVLD